MAAIIRIGQTWKNIHNDYQMVIEDINTEEGTVNLSGKVGEIQGLKIEAFVKNFFKISEDIH